MNEGIRKIALFASTYYLLKVLVKGLLLTILICFKLAAHLDDYLRQKRVVERARKTCEDLLRSKRLK